MGGLGRRTFGTMPGMPDRKRARELAAESIQKGDPVGWFEKLYQEAERGDAAIPWADLEPNPRLLDFWKTHPCETAGKRALVIGSGFGDDAEQLAAWGFKTTGFDVSKTAIESAKKRFPQIAGRVRGCGHVRSARELAAELRFRAGDLHRAVVSGGDAPKGNCRRFRNLSRPAGCCW